MPFRCEIVTQERVVFSNNVDYVSLPGTEGVMGVLPNHSAMLTALAFGEVMVRHQGKEEFFAVGGGFAEIQPDHITVLADSAEQAEEIDIERAQKARQHAEQMMKEGVPTDPVRYQQIQVALQKAQIRMDVARKRQHRRTMPHLSGDQT
jgi:F-type H+-transporting ATPase subunit epsilon